MPEASPSPLGFAVVGCGLIGRKRAAALARIPGAALRWACDLDLARAQDLARGAPAARTTADFRAAVAADDVQAVVIATLNGSLVPVAAAALAAGKHVLIEKPGARGASELRSLEAAARGSGLRVRVGYNHRFHPAWLKARELVDAGALGPLLFLRGRYGHGGRKGYDREWRADPAQSGGGELIDQGVHLIDVAGWMLGSFDRVEGHVSTLFWDMKVDDNAFVSLRTPAGQTAWLHASCSEWKNLYSVEIYGRDGKLAIDGLGGSYGTERLTFYKMLPQMGPPETTAWEYPGDDDSWRRETLAFVEDIRLGRAPSPGLTEAVRTLEIVGEIYQKNGYPHAP